MSHLKKFRCRKCSWTGFRDARVRKAGWIDGGIFNVVHICPNCGHDTFIVIEHNGGEDGKQQNMTTINVPSPEEILSESKLVNREKVQAICDSLIRRLTKRPHRPAQIFYAAPEVVLDAAIRALEEAGYEASRLNGLMSASIPHQLLLEDKNKENNKT